MKIYYKIVELVSPGKVKTLFHGIKGSRILLSNKWLKAEKKIVMDNGTPYLSGFHVLSSRQECNNYLKKFNLKKRELIVLGCYTKGLRRKKHSKSEVYLASQIYII